MNSPLQYHLRRLATAPRPGYRRALRKALRRRAGEMGMETALPLFSTFAWATRIGSVAFGLMIVVSGAIAYESPSVTRESPFYFIKQVGESIELAIARSPENIVDLRLRLAGRRLEEAAVLAKRGVVDIPTITEVTTNTQQAASAAKTVTPTKRRQVQQKLASAAETNVGALTSVSVTAQVASNKPVVVVKEDVLAVAPITEAINPQEAPAPPGLEIPQSNPGEGSVAGDPLAVRPSPPTGVIAVEPPVLPDPSVEALNAAISASEKIVQDVEDEATTEDPPVSAPSSIPEAAPSSAPEVPTAPAPSLPGAPVETQASEQTAG